VREPVALGCSKLKPGRSSGAMMMTGSSSWTCCCASAQSGSAANGINTVSGNERILAFLDSSWLLILLVVVQCANGARRGLLAERKLQETTRDRAACVVDYQEIGCTVRVRPSVATKGISFPYSRYKPLPLLRRFRFAVSFHKHRVLLEGYPLSLLLRILTASLIRSVHAPCRPPT
jgi:hypothetical protein